MPRTDVNYQLVTKAGLTPTYTTGIADGHQVRARPNAWLEFENTSGGALNVTIPTPATVDELAIADRVISVPANSFIKLYLGQLLPYTQSDGTIHIDYATPASIEFGAFSFG